MIAIHIVRNKTINLRILGIELSTGAMYATIAKQKNGIKRLEMHPIKEYFHQMARLCLTLEKM